MTPRSPYFDDAVSCISHTITKNTLNPVNGAQKGFGSLILHSYSPKNIFLRCWKGFNDSSSPYYVVAVSYRTYVATLETPSLVSTLEASIFIVLEASDCLFLRLVWLTTDSTNRVA